MTDVLLEVSDAELEETYARDAVGALLRDRAQRERLGRAAQQRGSRRFTWGRAAEVALAAYGRTLGGER